MICKVTKDGYIVLYGNIYVPEIRALLKCGERSFIMKHVMTGCAGCSLLLLLLSGCGPELAQTQLGAEEEQWQTQIQASYSSWQPPRSAPPATFDNRSADYKPVAKTTEDVELTVEKAADAPEAPAPDTVGIPGNDVKTEAAPEVQTAEKPEVKTEKAEAACYPAPAAATEEYVVQKGDTISKLAQKFYGDGRKYMPIIKANEAVLKGNPNRIYPGMKLAIPKF